MAVVDVKQIASGDDADCVQNNTGFNNNRGYLLLNQHVNTTLNNAAGLRFKIPTGVTAANITDVRLVLVAASAGTAASAQILAERGTANTAWATGAPNDPISRYNAAVSAGSTQVSWSIPTLAAGQVFASPNIATDVKVAMAAGTAGTDYIGVLIKMGIGGPAGVQATSFDNATSSQRPVLRITHTGTNGSTVTYTDLPYNLDGIVDATTASNFRILDINVPAGAAPPGGWKVYFWCHGGFWLTGTSTKSAIRSAMITRMQSLGYVVVNVEYDLGTSNAVSQTGNSFPQPVNALRAAIKYMATWASNFEVDTTKFVVGGESAGGHIALMTAVSMADTSNYTGYQNVNSNRKKQAPNTRPTFDFDCNVAAAVTLKGAFVWVAPVNVYNATVAAGSVNSTQAAINAIGRTTLMGEKQGTNPASTYRELDVDGYIDNTTNATYGTTTHEPTFPIGYVEGTADTIIDVSAGVTALYNALGTSGFTYARPSTGTTSATGLSRYQVATDHATAQDSTTGLDHFSAWDAAVFPATNLDGQAITTAEAHGQGVLTVGAVNLSGISITSGEVIGLGTITAGPRNLSGQGITTAEAHGQGVLNVGTPSTTNFNGQAITSGEAHGQGVLTASAPGAAALSGQSIPSAEAHGQGVLSIGAVNLSGAGIASTQFFGLGTITAGPVNMQGQGIASAEALGVGQLFAATPGAIGLFGTSIMSAEAHGQGVLTMAVAGVPTVRAYPRRPGATPRSL